MVIDQDINGGMTDTGRIIRDSRTFGPETCAGWNAQAIERLRVNTSAEQPEYIHRINELRENIRERYLRIQQAALDCTRKAGRDAELKDGE